jgi:hypothetical protein
MKGFPALAFSKLSFSVMAQEFDLLKSLNIVVPVKASPSRGSTAAPSVPRDARPQSSAASSDGAHAESSSSDTDIQSVYHTEVKNLMVDRANKGSIFGSSWKEYLGFFMPFPICGLGTNNSFWSRLNSSPTFQYLFSYDQEFVETLKKLHGAPLVTEIPAARITVHDVDATVNNCALICALLLGVPAAVIGDISGNQDGWIDVLQFMKDENGQYCQPGESGSALYSDFCLKRFEQWYNEFFCFTTVCFYSSLFTLITAVTYYMCRPSESCNNSSMNTLLKACTLEVRKEIRKARLSKLKMGAESEDFRPIAPDIPFDSWGEETEVFLKAKFMAKTEAEEQLNQVICL